MIDEVIIPSSNSRARLILSNPDFDSDPRLGYFVVTVEDAGLSASTRIYAYMSEGIVELFEDIAKNWRGWEGEKSAATIEGDFVLNCTSDAWGHTFVKVNLASQTNNWDVEAILRLDAGQLDGIAKQLKKFFNPK